MKMFRLAALLFAAVVAIQAQQTVTFRLHKFEQPIGVETVSFTQRGKTRQLDAVFEFTDRGSKVPLQASFLYARDYTPKSFSISGSTSRMSTIDDAITVDGGQAHVKTAGKAEQTVACPPRFFTIAGYAPAVMQEMLLRYWLKHGRPAQLDLLPAGSVAITAVRERRFRRKRREEAFSALQYSGAGLGPRNRMAR